MLSKREHLTCGSILLYVQKVKKVKTLAVCRFAHSLTTKRMQSVCVLYLSCLACLFEKYKRSQGKPPSSACWRSPLTPTPPPPMPLLARSCVWCLRLYCRTCFSGANRSKLYGACDRGSLAPAVVPPSCLRGVSGIEMVDDWATHHVEVREKYSLLYFNSLSLSLRVRFEMWVVVGGGG